MRVKYYEWEEVGPEIPLFKIEGCETVTVRKKVPVLKEAEIMPVKVPIPDFGKLKFDSRFIVDKDGKERDIIKNLEEK